MKVTRTEPPQNDPMFYAKLLEENKQLKEKIEKYIKECIRMDGEIKQLKEEIDELKGLARTQTFTGNNLKQKLEGVQSLNQTLEILIKRKDEKLEKIEEEVDKGLEASKPLRDFWLANKLKKILESKE